MDLRQSVQSNTICLKYISKYNTFTYMFSGTHIHRAIYVYFWQLSAHLNTRSCPITVLCRYCKRNHVSSDSNKCVNCHGWKGGGRSEFCSTTFKWLGKWTRAGIRFSKYTEVVRKSSYWLLIFLNIGRGGVLFSFWSYRPTHI